MSKTMDEAVEAAARAFAECQSELRSDRIAAALEAAAPFIRAQALEEAADHLMRLGWNNACTAHLRARAVAERGGSNNG